MAISGFASRLGFTRIILGAIAGAAGSCALILSLSDSASGAGPKCFGKHATIVGTPNADTLHGTAGRDVIVGRGHRDTIDGRGGNDLICGGGGGDTIDGGSEFDKIKGGPRPDELDGGPGPDDLFGEGGNDFVRGDHGADKLFGEQGIDTLDGGAGPDKVFGGAGPDGLLGGPNPGVADELFGGAGNDTLKGEEGEDNLFGGADDDDLDGGEDIDDCQQGTGTGPVVNCEADLAVDVVGPATAPPGAIPFRITVTNNGPSSVGYTLDLGSDNSNLMCPSSSLDTHSEPELAAGSTRTEIDTITCIDEDAPGGEVSVVATLSGPPDPNPGNNQDQAVTTVTG